jgi:exonuclease SbcC
VFKSIGIVNVQAHRETSIDLSKGVNVFTGPSDSGKSTLLRGLSWLFDNRPSGEVYRNWDSDISDSMAVEVVTSEGTSAAINREKGKTSYVLSPKNGEEMTFNAIRTDVPSEITEALNLASYNVQSQHQKYFLLQDTPGEVARSLNELTGLSIIDQTYKKADSEIRSTKADIENLKSERDEKKNQIKQYDNLEEIHELIQGIEKDTEELAKIEVALIKIEKSINDINKNKEEMAELQSLMEVEKEVDAVLILIAEYKEVDSKEYSIEALIHQLEGVEEDRKENGAWLEMEPSYSELTSLIIEWNKMELGISSLNSLVTSLTDIVEKKTKANAALTLITNKYITLLAEEGICPTCGTQLSSTMLEELQERL